MKSTTLVIMAAGVGNRFGGKIKQLEPVGPGGEIIMDYSIHDALEAGFGKIVFIIRRDLDKDFREVIGNRIERIAPAEHAHQELEDLPEGYVKLAERMKSWGTGQAILAAKDLVKEPFLVTNADDYYGKEGFRKIHQYMMEEMNMETDAYDMCMGGFILSNILSESGGVTKGVCVVNPNGSLEGVTETYNIERKGHGLFADDEEGNPALVSPDQYVSVNTWGFPPAFIQGLEWGFPEFLNSLKPGDLKAEYLLPRTVDKMIKTGKARVTVLEIRDKWFGVTYKEDRQTMIKAIRELIEQGVYPEKSF